MTFFIVISCFVALALLVGTFVERKRMSQFWQRTCTGRLWRQRFPHASKSEIREFLDVFIEAFGFSDRRRLCFAPDDRVMDVYRILYPVRGTADSMELEDLVTGLQDRYRVETLGSWREDITLGDLFTQTRPRGAYLPAAGNAGIASRLTVGHLRPGVPEPERSACPLA